MSRKNSRPWYYRPVDKQTGKQYYQHRAIAAWRIGRSLRPGEVVHHINGNRRDNHPDNLQVMPSRRAHALLHWYERRTKAGIQHIFTLEEYLRASGEDPDDND